MNVVKRKSKALIAFIFVLLSILCVAIVLQYKNALLIIANIIRRMQMHIHYILLPSVLLKHCDKKELKYLRI